MIFRMKRDRRVGLREKTWRKKKSRIFFSKATRLNGIRTRDGTKLIIWDKNKKKGHITIIKNREIITFIKKKMLKS
jgi:hypothetical protein